jgi:hypothetical protein
MSRAALAIIPGLFVGAAAAASLPVATATLSNGTADEVVCRVTNVSSGSIDVVLQVVNAIGVVQITSSGDLDPGVTMVAVDTTPADSYCRVTGASSKKVRLSLCMETAANNCIATATAP